LPDQKCAKDAGYIQLEPVLSADFMVEVANEDRLPSQIMRELMPHESYRMLYEITGNIGVWGVDLDAIRPPLATPVRTLVAVPGRL